MHERRINKMAIKIANAQRLFILKRKKDSDNVILFDPNPKMDPIDVMKFYSGEHPELTSSTVTGPVMKEEKAVYSFETIIGEKG